MPSTLKDGKLVTVHPKVTVSDGLHRLEWLSAFKAASLQTTVTNRHSRLEPSLEPSLIAPKAENSPFHRANEFVFVPSNPKPDVERQRVFEIALAREILESAYLDQTVGAWKICWAKGRHAWQRLCLDQGGTLDGGGLPSITAAAAIEWAKTRLETRNSATIPNQNEVSQ